MSDSDDNCRHEWSDDYRCVYCGYVQFASVPMEVVCTPMLAGPRNLWMTLWTFADRGTRKVFPSDAAILKRAGGIRKSALYENITWLRARGLISDTILDGRRAFRLEWPVAGVDYRATGRIYVLLFADTTVKIGRSSRATRRLGAHERKAISDGAPVTRRWLSARHSGVDGSERIILRKLAELGSAVEGTHERFAGITFDRVVEIASEVCS